MCKPVGRGNWAPMRLTYTGRQVLPMLVHVGDVIEFGGLRWRVCKVEP